MYDQIHTFISTEKAFEYVGDNSRFQKRVMYILSFVIKEKKRKNFKNFFLNLYFVFIKEFIIQIENYHNSIFFLYLYCKVMDFLFVICDGNATLILKSNF